MPDQLISAHALDKNHIEVKLKSSDPKRAARQLTISGQVSVQKATAKGDVVTLTTTDLDYRQNYDVALKDNRIPVDPGALLDEIISEKPLGCCVEGDRTVFRLFAPRAHRVKLVLFEKHTDEQGQEFDMALAEDGVWEHVLEGTHWGKYYGYRVAGPEHPTEIFRPEVVLADPYSRAVCTKNTFRHEAKSFILKTNDYDWEGDAPLGLAWEDLIIYEMHVRDLTAHPSSGARAPGTYPGLLERGLRGGIDHILRLGVNAVELLPCHEFANIEIPYDVETEGLVNTWNPYARNHWGYMTSYFFAPESYYASDGDLTTGGHCGVDGRQVREFKDLVKAFHREGIAVILDVVYNHVSHYDWNPLKYIDKKYYFRLDPHMNFLNRSGTGNDLKTERPMARRLIVDSVKYWLQEYHVDGFRFDLAAMIDWETVEAVTEAARQIHPDVILIAEPWGGGKYDLAGFSDCDWAAWNDQIRNGVKGQDPFDGRGWIFGHHWRGDDASSIRRYVRGATRTYGGPFKKARHSVNYFESHDDHTLGDFIRLGSGEVDRGAKITDLTANARLSERQKKLNKLAAAFLFTCQGPVMIGEGQEYARSKVIVPTDALDPAVGHIDHNSYNKDNETNWLNFEHAELNRDLINYYRGLIALRRKHAALRRTPGDKIRFLKGPAKFALAYLLPGEFSGDSENFLVLLNAQPEGTLVFTLPAGTWRRVVDAQRVGTDPFGPEETRRVSVPPTSALVLIQKT